MNAVVEHTQAHPTWEHCGHVLWRKVRASVAEMYSVAVMTEDLEKRD